MFLFLLTNGGNHPSYDFYDSCVVAALNEQDAKNISPDRYSSEYSPSWCAPEFVEVEYMGFAMDRIEAGVICASFNAG
jgi:hypothetical protein